MRNIKMILQYDGSRYNGWQKQGNTENTIQGKLESILSRYFGQEIEVHGSGRTDAGVHAKGQVANFKYDAKQPIDTGKMLSELNSYLPEDIRILTLEEAEPRFHARLNAKNKHYRYYLALDDKRDVFGRKYMAHINGADKLDIGLMKQAAVGFLGEHDFEAFSDNKAKKKSTVRIVNSIEFTQVEEQNKKLLMVDFYGNGFLYHMVRLMMGTLIAIGMGQADKEIINEIIESKNRKKVPFMAPAEGLFLQEVWY